MIVKRKIHGVVYEINIPKKQCQDCGQTFDPRTPASKRCPSCQKAFAEERRQSSLKIATPANDKRFHRCPYCGRETKFTYCKLCTHEGFDNVHKMFGYTNGWDSKPRKHCRIKAGWRGQVVVGGKKKFGDAFRECAI